MPAPRPATIKSFRLPSFPTPRIRGSRFPFSRSTRLANAVKSVPFHASNATPLASKTSKKSPRRISNRAIFVKASISPPNAKSSPPQETLVAAPARGMPPPKRPPPPRTCKFPPSITFY